MGFNLPSRSLLLVLLLGFPCLFWQNTALTNEDNMLAREFLLQFSNEPDLDLLEGSQLWHRYIDDCSLFACGNIYFLKKYETKIYKGE